MKKDSKYKWYALDIVLFTTINILLWRLIGPGLDVTDSITPLRLFIFGLATYRVADVIAKEGVAEFVRAPFMDYSIENSKKKWKPKEEGFRGFMGNLIGCPSCIGVWVAMGLFYLYIFFPTAGSIFMTIAALSGFERFFSKIYNFFDGREKPSTS